MSRDVKRLSEEYDEEEIARRRDEALLRALSTPHKKQSEMKLGKAKTENGTSSKKWRPTKKSG